MKILVLGDTGAEHLRRWAVFFARLGHEVHVVTWSPLVRDGYESVTVHQLVKPLSGAGFISRVVNLVKLMTETRRLFQQIHPDVIHSHDAGSYSWMAALSGFRPFVVTPWGSDILIHIHKSLVTHYFTARSLRRADLVQAEGEDTKNALLRLGVPSDKIVLLPLGVDLGQFSPGNPSPDFAKTHGLIGVPVVVSTRTPNPIHDVETTIRAAAIVLGTIPTVKFLIVGGGSELQTLRQFGESLGIGKSLVFMGYVTEERMIDCLRVADLYVSSSLSDSGTPASTAEAMACGLAVVSTDAGNIRERIHDGDGGYIVPCKDHVAIADRILHLLNDDDERRQAGARNRRYVAENINARAVIAKMEVIYFELAATHGGPRTG